MVDFDTSRGIKILRHIPRRNKAIKKGQLWCHVGTNKRWCIHIGDELQLFENLFSALILFIIILSFYFLPCLIPMG